jgi:hypothetical protein
MAQGVDGNWYGYFGDDTKISAVTPGALGTQGISFGTDGTPTVAEGDFNEALSVFHQDGRGGSTIQNAPALSNHNNTDSTQGSAAPAGQYYSIGQIGLKAASWPVIQTYDLSIETFDVVYEQAGADEVVTLNYNSADLDDYASLVLDRNQASQSSDIHLDIIDNQLNIDPTGEDVVIFYTEPTKEGVSFANKTSSITVTAYQAYDNSFDENGKLTIDNDTAGVNILEMDTTNDDGTADNLVVFYEAGENSGMFSNYDDSDNSNIDVKRDALRGYTATFSYNDSSQSFVVANDFGVIDMDASSVGDVWNSGEELTVTLIDQDLNKNTISDEDLSIQNTTNTHLIPTLTIGSPVSLSSNDAGNNFVTNATSYSKIMYYTNSSADIGADTGSTKPYVLKDVWTTDDILAIDTVNTYFNYDVTSFSNATNDITLVSLVDGDGAVVVSEANSAKGIIEISSPSTLTAGEQMKILISTSQDNGAKAVTSIPVVADIMSFGNTTNNGIYRLLLEESGENTATFEGTVEYKMLNQINVDEDATYNNLDTIDMDIEIIVHEDLTDEDSPRVNYLDTGADGVGTQIADQVEAPTPHGVV